MCEWAHAADQAAPADAPAVMETVVVSASREAEAAARVPARVTVIEADAIQRSNARNVPEVLEAAGLHVSDIAGNQRSYTVDQRGFGEVAQLNLLVLVDGRRINEADLSAADWALIPLERIDRIEVLSGPRGSVLYGDNSSGGVINIITKEGKDRFQGTASVQYGSYETFKGVAGVSGAAGLVSYNVLANYLDSDGYRENSATETKQVGATVKLDPSDRVALDFSGGYHEDSTRLPGAIYQAQLDAGASPTETFHPDDFSDTKDYYLKTGIGLFYLSDDNFKLDLSYRNRSVDQYLSGSWGWATGDTSIDTIAVSPKFTFQEDFGDVSNRFLFGGDYSKYDEAITNRSSVDPLNPVVNYDLEKETIGYYVQDDLGVTPNLTLSGGYRYDRADYSFSPGPENDRRYDEDAYNVGINYATGLAKVYFAYGKSYRFPVFEEIFSFISNTVDSSIRPQASKNFEAGMQIQLLEGMTMSFNLFRLDTEDEIYFNPLGGPFGFGANENLDGDTRREGFEMDWNMNRSGWTAGVRYTYMEAKIREGQYKGNTIPNVPKNRASADLGYTFDMGLFLGISGVYVGERYLISDFNNVSRWQEAYTVINAKARYDWRMLTFFLNLNNLLDESYASYGVLDFTGDPAYYPSPDFNLLGGVTARFGG